MRLSKLQHIAGAFLVSSTLGGTHAHAADAVKIGFITTLTGAAGYLGEDVRDGFNLAVKQGNGLLGGQKVDVVIADDGLKPSTGRQLADRFLYDEQADIITGMIFSNVASAIIPEVIDAGKIVISPNAGPTEFAGVNCNANYFVMSWLTDSMQGSAGRNAKALGFKRAMVLAPNFQAGKDAVEGFRRTFEGEIIEEVYTSLDQIDYAAEMARIRSAKPDVVFQFHPGALGIAFLRQYQQSGLLNEIPMVVAEPSMDHAILRSLGGITEGLNVSGSWNVDLNNDANKQFVAAFQGEYGRTPTMYAAQGYDTARAIGAALAHTGGDFKDPQKFRSAMLKADFSSVRGNFAFGKNQHPVQDWYAMRVENDGKGGYSLVTKDKIAEMSGDVFADECKLEPAL
ncbi:MULTISPECIES: ABC transporter substrate-binding protein [Brucella/Ochrobactrum group]|uniref:ABC transporter substrate binding protein n=1 Tax=Ochrobactrum soli TaxID=2448455 RepID=A0A2P9HBT7_9HYPH|nr:MULTISPECIES: ABC transporter substrate-binding protein [Brucella]MDX4072129.1 ABC transporter substrate-binding protein [Brucella sp. NBRC 113783]SPL61556.1 ABC transporter substrate binding protein [[Ochrobactrum] soli]